MRDKMHEEKCMRKNAFSHHFKRKIVAPWLFSKNFKSYEIHSLSLQKMKNPVLCTMFIYIYYTSMQTRHQVESFIQNWNGQKVAP